MPHYVMTQNVVASLGFPIRWCDLGLLRRYFRALTRCQQSADVALYKLMT